MSTESHEWDVTLQWKKKPNQPANKQTKKSSMVKVIWVPSIEGLRPFPRGDNIAGEKEMTTLILLSLHNLWTNLY